MYSYQSFNLPTHSYKGPPSDLPFGNAEQNKRPCMKYETVSYKTRWYLTHVGHKHTQTSDGNQGSRIPFETLEFSSITWAEVMKVMTPSISTLPSKWELIFSRRDKHGPMHYTSSFQACDQRFASRPWRWVDTHIMLDHNSNVEGARGEGVVPQPRDSGSEKTNRKRILLTSRFRLFAQQVAPTV